MKHLRRSILGVALLGAAAAAAALDAARLLRAPMSLADEAVLLVEAGDGLHQVIAQLTDAGALPEPRAALYLRLHARLTGLSTQIKAGEYQVKRGMSALDVLDLVVAGKTLLHTLRIAEGGSFAGLMEQVRSSTVLRQTLAGKTDEEILGLLGHAGQHPEGRFFPDTYHFPRQTTDLAFLRRAAVAMDAALNEEWANRAPDLPYKSPDEALIMASIIEKETGLPDERPAIAGVFVRRLQAGIKLQTDPTVIYGLGAAFDGNLRKADLLADTPYNTYTRGGLPPTPICLPSRASIHAALHPQAGTALFFVARGDGGHVFSDTLEQHNAAVREFQLKRRGHEGSRHHSK